MAIREARTRARSTSSSVPAVTTRGVAAAEGATGRQRAAREEAALAGGRQLGGDGAELDDGGVELRVVDVEEPRCRGARAEQHEPDADAPRAPGRARGCGVGEELEAVGVRSRAADELVVEDGEDIVVGDDDVHLALDQRSRVAVPADGEGERDLALHGAGRPRGEALAE